MRPPSSRACSAAAASQYRCRQRPRLSPKRPRRYPRNAAAGSDGARRGSDQQALLEKQKTAVGEAEHLRTQYDYEAALEKLASPELAGGIVDEEIAAIRSEMERLVNYEGDIAHIFFHSLIVYPEMIFKDLSTPEGGYNAGFAEKAELEKILPQLYERGYVLYDLNECWEMTDGKMTRKQILLPPGKKPLILSVDDVAYAYGDGYAQALTVNSAGELVYLVKTRTAKPSRCRTATSWASWTCLSRRIPTLPTGATRGRSP